MRVTYISMILILFVNIFVFTSCDSKGNNSTCNWCGNGMRWQESYWVEVISDFIQAEARYYGPFGDLNNIGKRSIIKPVVKTSRANSRPPSGKTYHRKCAVELGEDKINKNSWKYKDWLDYKAKGYVDWF